MSAERSGSFEPSVSRYSLQISRKVCFSFSQNDQIKMLKSIRCKKGQMNAASYQERVGNF